MTDSILKEIFENPGLYHIAQTVSSFLDAKSLSKCRLVCQSWRDLIDNDRPWLVFQLDYIHRQEKIFLDPFQEGEAKKVTATIEDRFPEWSAFIQQISKKQRTPRLQSVVRQMWIYFKDDQTGYYRFPLLDAIAKSNIAFVQLLIDCGIDLNMKSPEGATPMHYASQFGDIEIAKVLTKNLPTFDPTLKLDDGSTIFHCASYNSDPQVIKLILDTFKFEDMRDKDGWTMLQHAVYGGPKETIQFLIESRQKLGLNLEDMVNNGDTILHIAYKKRDIDIVDIVFNALVDINSDIDFDF